MRWHVTFLDDGDEQWKLIRGDIGLSICLAGRVWVPRVGDIAWMGSSCDAAEALEVGRLRCRWR